MCQRRLIVKIVDQKPRLAGLRTSRGRKQKQRRKPEQREHCKPLCSSREFTGGTITQFFGSYAISVQALVRTGAGRAPRRILALHTNDDLGGSAFESLDATLMLR